MSAKFKFLGLIYVFCSPFITMMRLCIILYMYWTPQAYRMTKIVFCPGWEFEPPNLQLNVRQTISMRTNKEGSKQ